MSAKSNITKSPTGSGALVVFAEPSKIPLKVRDAQGTGRITVAGSAASSCAFVSRARAGCPTRGHAELELCGWTNFQPPVTGPTTSRECGRAGVTRLQPTTPGVGSPTTAAPGNSFDGGGVDGHARMRAIPRFDRQRPRSWSQPDSRYQARPAVNLLSAWCKTARTLPRQAWRSRIKIPAALIIFRRSVNPDTYPCKRGKAGEGGTSLSRLAHVTGHQP